MKVYDIGANVGFYTLFMSRFVGPEGKVFAFEPLPRNIQFLKQHVTLNLIENVHIFECALGDKSGEALFDTHQNVFEGKISLKGDLKIKMYSIDDLIHDHLIEPAALVKIDVEGGEFSVLVGGTNYFRTVKPVIFLATHGKEIHNRCCQLMKEWGYNIYSIDQQQSPNESDELFAISI